MTNLVYFPTFEPPTQTWLKFALLYIENFNPIIPRSGRNVLSEDYQRIINETDLITPYEPLYNQGDRASIKAIEYIEKLDRYPHRFANLFNIPNLSRVIRNDDQKNFKIFEEKFSLSWAAFCVENRLGERTEGGINVTEELAFIFMSFLAEEIAFEEGKSIITDNHKFDNFLNHQRVFARNIITRGSFAQGVLGLSVPRNISEIPMQNLIEFRNRNRDKIRAFNVELDNSINNVQAGVSEREFVERFNNIYSELTTEILTQGLGITSIPLATYIMLQNPTIATSEYISQIIGGLGIVLTAKVAISTKWNQISNRHNCKRYLTNLERLR
jgi:hypothetical protein